MRILTPEKSRGKESGKKAIYTRRRLPLHISSPTVSCTSRFDPFLETRPTARVFCIVATSSPVPHGRTRVGDLAKRHVAPEDVTANASTKRSPYLALKIGVRMPEVHIVQAAPAPGPVTRPGALVAEPQPALTVHTGCTSTARLPLVSHVKSAA